MIAVSVGVDYRSKHVERHDFADFGELVESILKRQAEGGHYGPYLCSAMRGERCGENAEPAAVMPIDFDELAAGAPRSICEAIAAAGWRAATWTTRKSKPEAPRLRVLLELDRPLAKPEYAACYRGVVRFLAEKTGLPLKGDAACEKPEQPAILPQPQSTVWMQPEGAPIVTEAFIAYDPGPAKKKANGLAKNAVVDHPRIGDVLARFENVRQAAPDRWTACCPAHASASRSSLSIRVEGERILVHDFGGCGTEDVLATVGLSLRDLFTEPATAAPPELPPVDAYADEERAAIQNEPPLAAPARAADPLRWMEGIELSTEEAEQIADPAWVFPGLIAEGHVIAVVAKPNGGKTSILFDIACQIARRYTTIFVDADTNPADAKRKLRLAREHGVRYLTPDLKVGKSMRDVVAELERLAASDVDLTGHVWFFDTLKRMANVIQKESLKHVLQLMRKLSSRGMTCVLLGHTNKYCNADGEYVFEGTGDLEADVDELIYFEPRENPDKSLTVSTRCTKRRANIASFTWDIAPDRSVTQRDHYVDVAAEQRRREQEEEDSATIEAINECLANGPKKQTELVEHCNGYRIPQKRLRTVLRRYRGRYWLEGRLPEKNAIEYRAIPRFTALPEKQAELPNRDLL